MANQKQLEFLKNGVPAWNKYLLENREFQKLKIDLKGADIEGACLNGAKLIGANLSGTNLSRANLNGVDLSFTNINGADLSGAKIEPF